MSTVRVAIFTMQECGEKCPYYEHNSGMGHCDDFDMCKKARREIETKDRYDFATGRHKKFPEWCPLEEKET
jgi:hypothetical protein